MSESRKYIEYGKILDKGFKDGLNEAHDDSGTEVNKMNSMSERDKRDIEILMADGCTKNDAIKHINAGAIVYEDLEENLDLYLAEMEQDCAKGYCDEETIEGIKNMVITKDPLPDWCVVNKDGKYFFIAYAL